MGISKIARLVEGFARRPQVQERLTNQVAMAMMDNLDCRGVAVVMNASHSCMSIRGIKKPGSSVTTSAMLGIFRENQASRSEVLSLINSGRT